jgi:vesicle coat complex subunit
MKTLFAPETKTDISALRDTLDGTDPDARKTAARRVVNLMRTGENVQSLFTSMLRCVRTTDLEFKKLIYIYLITYSSQEPEQAIMAVNAFIQDSEDPNPLIRALAVRNMCRIRLENVAEYMILPLKKALGDRDPYVRKTAAFGVAKLYDVIPEAVENSQLFTELLKLLRDENPMVVSNTTAAVTEINERRTTPVFQVDSQSIGIVVNSLPCSSEWCQTILFESLSRYKPVNSEDSQFLIERLSPFLKSNNPGVVIGAFKCIYRWASSDVSSFSSILPAFLALVNSSECEIQYVALRTVSLFVQKYPRLLSREIRIFFCKYTDPSYVKLEKLDILVNIVLPSTAQLVLDEFSEYANDVDVLFVRKTVRSIGQIALNIEAASRKAVDVLVRCLQGKADYAAEEAVIAVSDILRRFPGDFESILGTVCLTLERPEGSRRESGRDLACWRVLPAH